MVQGEELDGTPTGSDPDDDDADSDQRAGSATHRALDGNWADE